MRAVESNLGHPSNTREEEQRENKGREARQFPVLARTLEAPEPFFRWAVVGRGARDGNHLVFHERIANRRDGSFLLTGLGAIRNRASCLFSPVRRYRRLEFVGRG